MAESRENLRRSSRIKKPVEYTGDDDDERGKSTRSRTRRGSRCSTNAESDIGVLEAELEKDLEKIEEDAQKPTELFADEEDVSGQRMFGFATPSKRGAMAQKAALSRPPSTPQTPKQQPKTSDIRETAQTPHRMRNKIKKSLESISRKSFTSGLTSSESESVSEESEYVPSDTETKEIQNETSESSSASGEDEEANAESDSGNEQTRTRSSSPLKTTSMGGRKSKSSVAHKEYHLKTDEYFELQSEKSVTSDRTLGRLKNPRLDEEKLQLLLAGQNHISKEHKKGIQSLSEGYRALFPMWCYIMEEGYSLLLHGLGSKRNLMNDFHKEMVFDHPTLVVNGFFPSLTIKEILDGIIVDLLELDCPSNTNDCVDLIVKVMTENPEDRLYLLVHNIDGVMLRSNKAQETLSLLASIPNICLMASVDHINAPLIWDNVKRSRYNFCWWDTTTLLPYEAETAFESSLLVQRSGALALSSLRNVFLSLTSNARSIYILLVKHQLNNASNSNYPGMAFKDLYRGAREAFLVSSDVALRAQLTEFLDHKLVRSKRHIDGAEYLIIPLDNALLKQFLEQQDA